MSAVSKKCIPSHLALLKSVTNTISWNSMMELSSANVLLFAITLEH